MNTNTPHISNLLTALPAPGESEAFDILLSRPGICIERIVSHGHSSPRTGWYQQARDEWVLVLKGSGTIVFRDDREVSLQQGDYLHIPAQCEHRVSRTEADQHTVWLAIHFD